MDIKTTQDHDLGPCHTRIRPLHVPIFLQACWWVRACCWIVHVSLRILQPVLHTQMTITFILIWIWIYPAKAHGCIIDIPHDCKIADVGGQTLATNCTDAVLDIWTSPWACGNCFIASTAHKHTIAPRHVVVAREALAKLSLQGSNSRLPEQPEPAPLAVFLQRVIRSLPCCCCSVKLRAGKCVVCGVHCIHCIDN